jgi:peptidoglycan-associated lipoprotein
MAAVRWKDGRRVCAKGWSRERAQWFLSESLGRAFGEGRRYRIAFLLWNERRQRAEITKEEKAAIEAGLQDVFFGYDQWSLSDAGMEALNGDAQWLKDHPGAVMKVEGHCDERGTADYNIVLGDKRAKAARSYLVESGVAPKQVAIVSYGKARPFCTDPAESCYQQNRRGHVLLNVKK